MQRLFDEYKQNVEYMEKSIRVSESFDIISRKILVGEGEVNLFYVDGFIKDSEMLKIMQHLLSQKQLFGAEKFVKTLPYIEVEVAFDFEKIIKSVLSGQAAIFAESFSDEAVLVDARTYPARQTAEPDSDRVMQGAHDGFVETLVINTALIRRRIRDARLTMRHFDMGGVSKTDVVMCYMEGVADPTLVEKIAKKLEDAKPKTLTLGFQSLSETLIRKRWYNPFPKIRTTERPDTAAAQLVEGSILVICDTSPQVMILPTSIFHYLEQTDDYYFPPLTGTYLRIVRALILLLSVVITPLWYLSLEYAEILPDGLKFLVPDNPGALPIILQLLLAELAIDGLKIASMNTPDMLSNSLSIVGGLILGDFAVTVGWLSPDVILYMAFVAIANFAQQNNELGYAIKFMRVLILILVFFFDVYGLAAGLLLSLFFVTTNKTVTDEGYLYPLLPFSPKAMKKLLIRGKKSDFEQNKK